MPEIRVLDQSTINQIAAGEVVERPSSIVKELVENAVDANSTAVTVEIKGGGIDFIRITDNGCGIEKEQVRKAFLPHATSKIRSASDLETVVSLGFRGEALSSIASVAKVELVTKTDEGCGTDELDIVWLNDGLLLIAEKDAVVQGRTLNRAFYRLPVNNETDKKSADVKNTVHNKISNKDLESLKPERIFAGNLVVLKIESTSDGSNELVDIIDEDIEFIESVLRPIERIYAGVVYLKKEKDLGQKSVD